MRALTRKRPSTPTQVYYCCAQRLQTVPARRWQPLRGFAADAARLVTVPLSQTGEGIKECELIEWHIKVLTARSATVMSRREVIRQVHWSDLA